MNNIPADSDLYIAKRSEALHKYEMYVNMKITFYHNQHNYTSFYIVFSQITSWIFQFGWFGETALHPFP